jgi:hypothetical protein
VRQSRTVFRDQVSRESSGPFGGGSGVIDKLSGRTRGCFDCLTRLGSGAGATYRPGQIHDTGHVRLSLSQRAACFDDELSRIFDRITLTAAQQWEDVGGPSKEFGCSGSPVRSYCS